MSRPEEEIRGGEHVSWGDVRPGEPFPGSDREPGNEPGSEPGNGS